MRIRRTPNRHESSAPSRAGHHAHVNGKKRPRQREEENLVYGLIPVIEALRAGKRQIEEITIAEGAKPERLRHLLELAREVRVPIRRVPRFELDRTLGGVNHQ